MKQNKTFTFNKTMLILIAILFAMAFLGLFFGAFFDFQIDQKLAGDAANFRNDHYLHTFWSLCSSVAGYVFMFITTFAATALISLNSYYKNWKKPFQVFYWIIAVGIGFACIWWQAYDSIITNTYYTFNITIPPHGSEIVHDFIWESLLVAIGFFGIGLLVNFFVVKKTTYAPIFFKWALFATFALIFACVIVTIMKSQLHRERYFQLMITGNTDNFKPWYSLLWNMNNAGDGRFTVGEMTSFPSGHTTWAMGVFTLAPLFYLLLKDKQKTLIILFSALFAFLLLIIFCRICGGYHYLSDIAMAIVVNTVPFIGVGYFVYCQPNKQK